MRQNTAPYSLLPRIYEVPIYTDNEDLDYAFDLAKAAREVLLAAGCRPLMAGTVEEEV